MQKCLKPDFSICDDDNSQAIVDKIFRSMAGAANLSTEHNPYLDLEFGLLEQEVLSELETEQFAMGIAEIIQQCLSFEEALLELKRMDAWAARIKLVRDLIQFLEEAFKSMDYGRLQARRIALQIAFSVIELPQPPEAKFIGA